MEDSWIITSNIPESAIHNSDALANSNIVSGKCETASDGESEQGEGTC